MSETSSNMRTEMDNLMPLISVIIPVYNAERYLVRCLDSVLTQDYSNIEVILIDDGSTDGSGAICDEYAWKYTNVRVCHIPNGGASLARKKGIDIAEGKYLTFVDSDDFVTPNYVSSMFNLIVRYKTKISACGVKRVKVGDDHIENESRKDVISSQSEECLLSFDELMPRFFKYDFWGFPAGLYHCSLFDGIIFPKATLSEDYYVKMQMFCREHKLAETKAPLYFYEYHSTSLSHTKISIRAFEEFENVKAVYEYAQKHCPKYADYALSNVVETSVKLFTKSRSVDVKLYADRYNEVFTFLKKNLKQIWALNVLNKHVQLIACGIGISPSFMRILCRWL